MKLCPPYKIIFPPIPSAGLYYFTTDSKVKYEVRFGYKKDCYLHATIVFGVINEEYNGEEYVETNKGEHYRIMSTIIDIWKHYNSISPQVRTFEFSAVNKQSGNLKNLNSRLKFYTRYIDIVLKEKKREIIYEKSNNKVKVLLLN
jgi:hypothetical protein